MEVDVGILSAVLTWLVSGGGAGVLAYFLMEKVPELQQAQPEYKRYISLALAAVLSMAAFAVAVAFGYHAEPASEQGWFEALFAVAFIATGLGQVIHGKVKLGKR